MKKLIFSLILLFLVSTVSASYTIVVHPLDEDGNEIPKTVFDYRHEFSNDSSCSNVIFSNDQTIETSEAGIAVIQIDTSSVSQIPKYICEYKNLVLRAVLNVSDQFFDKIYAESINLTDYITANNFFGNISADFVKIALGGGSPTVDQLQEYLDNTGSSGFFVGGDLSDGGSGTVDISAGSGFIRTTNDPNAELQSFKWDAVSGMAVPDNTTQYVYVDNTGTISLSTNEFLEAPNKIKIGVATDEGGSTIHTFKLGVRLEEGIGEAGRFIRRVHGIERNNRLGGLILGQSGDANRDVTMTAGQLEWGRTSYVIPSFDTSGADTFFTYSASGLESSTASQWDNLQYDNSGTLTTLGNNKWANLFFFLEPDNHIVMMYGRNQFNSQALAENEGVPSSSLPSRVSETSILISRFTFQKSSNIATISSAFDALFANAGVTDHGNLAGLTDDDHIQYLLEDGTRSLSAEWNVGNNIINITYLQIDEINMTGNLLTIGNASENETIITIVGLGSTSSWTLDTVEKTFSFGISGWDLKVGRSRWGISGGIGLDVPLPDVMTDQVTMDGTTITNSRIYKATGSFGLNAPTITIFEDLDIGTNDNSVVRYIGADSILSTSWSGTEWTISGTGLAEEVNWIGFSDFSWGFANFMNIGTMTVDKITATTTDPKLMVYTPTTRDEVLILDSAVSQDKKGMNVYFNSDTGIIEYWNTLTREIRDKNDNILGSMDSLGTIKDEYFLNYTDNEFYRKTYKNIQQENGTELILFDSKVNSMNNLFEEKIVNDTIIINSICYEANITTRQIDSYDCKKEKVIGQKTIYKLKDNIIITNDGKIYERFIKYKTIEVSDIPVKVNQNEALEKI